MVCNVILLKIFWQFEYSPECNIKSSSGSDYCKIACSAYTSNPRFGGKFRLHLVPHIQKALCLSSPIADGISYHPKGYPNKKVNYMIKDSFTQKLKWSLTSISYKFIQIFFLFMAPQRTPMAGPVSFLTLLWLRRKLNNINYISKLVLNFWCQFYMSGLKLVNF